MKSNNSWRNDWFLEVSEFELQSRNYDPFQKNNLGYGMNSLISPAIG